MSDLRNAEAGGGAVGSQIANLARLEPLDVTVDEREVRTFQVAGAGGDLRNAAV